jgi:fluoride exporter
MTKILLIGLGGGLGAIARYFLSFYIQQAANTAIFPLGTLVVNTLGCLVIGALSYLADVRGLFTPEARALAFTGFLGGFTTFSTFGHETMALVRDGENGAAFANLSLHVLLGLGAVWAGRALAAVVWR